jgi:polar amino acid transport system substrate-binding protein
MLRILLFVVLLSLLLVRGAGKRDMYNLRKLGGQRMHTRRALAGFALAAALSAPALAEADLIETYRAEGVTVGLAGYAPYGYKLPDGSFTGEQVEVVEHVFNTLGITDIEYVVMDFGALIPAMVAGRVAAAAAAGIYIRPQRCEQVLLSEPTFGQRAAYVVKAGSPKGLDTFKDMAATDGAVLAVLAGGTKETLAKRDGVPDEKLLKVGEKAAGMAAVISGRADGFALSALAIADIARTAGELVGVESSGSITEIAGEVYKGHGAIAFAKAQDEAALVQAMAFRDAFDEVLAAYLAADGGYAAMAAGFGFTEAERPAATMEELCAEGL